MVALGKKRRQKVRPRVESFMNLPTNTPFVSTRQVPKKQHSTILTSTPIKGSLMEKENKKKKRNLGKRKGKTKRQREGQKK